MLNKLIMAIKVIVKQISISFFFASIIIVVFTILFQDKVNLAVSIIDKMSVVRLKEDSNQMSFDSVKKKLKEYPDYGTIFATLSMPSLGVEKKVYHGDTLDLLRYHLGHFAGSYFPGENGTIIISGHNSYTRFGKITELKIGDNVIITTSYGTFTYEVTGTDIMHASVLENNLQIQREYEMLLMYTCYPIGSLGFKNERYIVYAKLVGEEYAS